MFKIYFQKSKLTVRNSHAEEAFGDFQNIGITLKSKVVSLHREL